MERKLEERLNKHIDLLMERYPILINLKEDIINAAKSIDSIVKERNAIIRKCRIN